MNLDDYASLRQPASPYSPARAPQSQHPQGWEPGIAWDGKSRTIAAQTSEAKVPNWDALIVHFGFDPAEVEVIDDTVQCRTWQIAKGDPESETGWNVQDLFYYKATLRSRSGDRADRADIEGLMEEIRTHEFSIYLDGDDSRALVVNIADPQFGKADGDGTAGTIARFLEKIGRVAERIVELQVETVYVFGLGDIIEGCDGFYSQQTFSVELDRRDQRKVARRLITKGITTWAPLVKRMVVAAVGGNHGENRKDGKSYTTFADNDDVAIFEEVAEIVGANPEAYGHVSFVLPTDELAMTFDVMGTNVAITHGHQAKTGGGNVQEKLKNWWKGQSFGGAAAGDATILISGHYHHFSVVEHGKRTHFQCPALDGGSEWFAQVTGDSARSGLLTFTVGPDGWDNLAIL